MRIAFAFLTSTVIACGASSADDDPAVSGSGDAFTQVETRVASDAAVWDTRCQGAPLDEPRARALLGNAKSRVLGRFRLAVRNACFTPEMPECGGQRRPVALPYRLGLAPTRSEEARAYWKAPLYVPDEGDVVVGMSEGRAIVYLAGDLGGTNVKQDDGTTKPLFGRILSTDLLRGSHVEIALGTARSITGAAPARFEPFVFNTPESRTRGIRDLGAEMSQWREDIGSYFGEVSLTESCLRISYAPVPDRIVRADFVAAAP